MAMAAATGGLIPKATMAPSTTTDRAMPISMNGTGISATARKPPSAMTAMKVSGTSHSARPPSLVGEEADQDHGEQMVETAERMHEAVREAAGVADPGMGQRRGRSQAKRERGQLQNALHEQTSLLGCKCAYYSSARKHS